MEIKQKLLQEKLQCTDAMKTTSRWKFLYDSTSFLFPETIHCSMAKTSPDAEMGLRKTTRIEYDIVLQGANVK